MRRCRLDQRDEQGDRAVLVVHQLDDAGQLVSAVCRSRSPKITDIAPGRRTPSWAVGRIATGNWATTHRAPGRRRSRLNGTRHQPVSRQPVDLAIEALLFSNPELGKHASELCKQAPSSSFNVPIRIRTRTWSLNRAFAVRAGGPGLILCLDQGHTRSDRGRGDECVATAGQAGGVGDAVTLPGGVLRVSERTRGCPVRADGRAAVHGRAGEDAGGPVACSGTPSRARVSLRRAEPRPHRCCPAAPGPGGAAAAEGGRRPPGPGRGRLTVAAPGRRHLPGPLVLPHLRPRRGQAPDDPGLAVLGRGCAGDRPHVLDRRAGRRPAVAWGRCRGRHHRPDPRHRRTACGRRPVDERRPDILVVLDAGYDAPRIAHLLGDLPVEVLGRMRSDRVLRRPTPPRVSDPKHASPTPRAGGRPSTAASSSSATPPRGTPSRPSPSPTPASTAR
ncbi:hypothetical protein QFZ55_001073 [Streptomyces luteogriseus]|nr:hypothetical protein [Streptomyces luteogriseus]